MTAPAEGSKEGEGKLSLQKEAAVRYGGWLPSETNATVTDRRYRKE
jgi:hypothetical protein